MPQRLHERSPSVGELIAQATNFGFALVGSSMNALFKLIRACSPVMAVLALATNVFAADFGTRGGASPANIKEIAGFLDHDPYDLELLISYGTSGGGSAGHLALAIRDSDTGAGTVYSANFYADRSRKHATGFYNADLMIAVPKDEYLFRTSSSLGDTASFGLDYGEIYKRSVIGVRVFGVPADEKKALVGFMQRMNDDYHKRARNTEYHDREVKYDYLRLNCAKTIGSAFRYGAGYTDLDTMRSLLLPGRPLAAAANADIPTEMALKLLEQWNARGYRMDTVLYKKYPGSPYIDPRDDPPIAFKDLPNRFPSVLSRDFRKEHGQYEDPDNLFAMYLLFNLARYSVQVNEQTRLLEIARMRTPFGYREAARLAAEAARSDSGNYGRRVTFEPKGTRVGDDSSN
jgi:hypothetical protein